MKNPNLSKWLLLFSVATIFSCFMLSCEPDDTISSETKEVNRYIKETMDFVYLWRDDMPKLNPDRQHDSKKFFYELLNDTYDHWSYITDDYQSLKNSLSGIEYSMGYTFKLYRLNNMVIGIVEYVDKGGPAERANIKRGDVLYKINGTEMTIDNYYDLLTQNSYVLTLGAINSSSQIVALSPTVNLTAEVLNVNPVYIDTIYSVGSRKVGYLVYNAFVDEYKTQLTSTFNKFKAENVSDLVLDLRYNGGGSVNVAKLLASMIGPSSIAGKTMMTSIYNDLLTEYYQTTYPNEPGIFSDAFESSTINLNLNRLIVLTTDGTASASEMVIYTLKPYMDVVQIGKVTQGKYYASIVIPGPGNKETWAIMPLIMKAQNANNSINYLQGQVPNYDMPDDYDHQLGDLDEALLAKAISVIDGTNAQTSPGLKSGSLKALGIPIAQAKERLNPEKFKLVLKQARLTNQ